MLIGETQERLTAINHEAVKQLILLGKKCAVMLSGFEEDADRIQTLEGAFCAIEAALDTEREAVRELDEGKGVI